MSESAPTPNRRWFGWTKFAKSPSRVYPLAFLLTYVVLFGYYDLRQVPRQRAALLSQDFRRLALASDRIRSRIENLARLMEAQADRVQEDLSVQKLASGRHFDPKPEAGATASNFSYSPCAEDQPVKPGISFAVMPGDESVLHAQIVKGDVHLCGESSLKPSIQSATNDLIGGALADIAVVTSSGRVIYQYQSSGLRLASLGSLGEWATSPAKPATEGGQTSSGSAASRPPPTPHSGIDYSRTIDLSFAEHKYKLLLQPIVLPVADFASNAQNSGKPESLALVGVVDEDVLTAQARALPYATLINLTAIILLGLIMTWPILKIWKMGPAESFRPGETLAFGISVVAATWLITVGIVYNIQVFNYESTDRSLGVLSRTIENNFKDEIKAALNTLQKVSVSKPVSDDFATLRKARAGAEFISRADVLDRSKRMNAAEAAADYPWFDQIFWTDEKGEQILKWSTQRRATGRTIVSSESWFARVKNGQFWWLDEPRSGKGPQPLVLDALYSPNTADYFGIVAQPMDLAGQRVVATLVSPFVSVIEPLIRPSDGFAILDETGTVRFHSDAGKNSRENFLNEITHSDELKTAISTAAAIRFTAHYNGNKVRLFAKPLTMLRNSTWTLIVFRDLTLDQRFFLNTLVLTILYSLGYFLSLALAARVGMNIVDRLARDLGSPKMDWFRPSEKERVVLWALAGCLLLLLCAFRLFSHLDLPLPVYLLAVLGLPPSGVLLSYFALRYPAAAGRLYRAGFAPSPSRWKAARVSVLGATLLLVLLSIFPAVELFEIAFNDSVLANMEDAQIGLAKNIRRRNDRVYAYSRRISYGTGGAAVQPDTGLLEKRLAETRDRYSLPVPCGQTQTANREGWAGWWLPQAQKPRWTQAGRQPQASWLFRHTAHLLRDLIPFPETVKAPAPGESPWTWKFGAPCAGVSELDLFPTPSDPQDRRTAYPGAIPDFPITAAIPAYPDHPAGPLLILLLIVFLYRFVHYTVLRRLSLDFTPPASPWESVALRDVAQDIDRNTLCIDLPRNTDVETVTAMDVKSICHIFELDAMLQDPDWDKQIGPTTRLVVIVGLQTGIKNRDLNERTLAIIERIVEEPKRKLLLISTIDPIYYLYQGQLREVRKLQANELEIYSRWMNALNSFEVFRLEQNAGQALGREEWHLLWDSCAPREQLALWQLAHDCIVNPNNTGAIEHLYRRGLVEFDKETGHFRIFNPDFQQFVLSELPQRQLELLIKSNQDTAWNGLKWAMIYTGLALPLFLAFTAADFWDLGFGKLLTIGSAGAAAIQTFSKIAELASAKVSKGGGTSA